MLTLQRTYTIHIMILSPLKNWSSFLRNSSLWSFDIPDFNSSSKVILVLSWFLFFLPILFPDFVSWNRLLHVEAGSRYQSVQWNRGLPERRCGSLFVFSLDFGFFYHSLLYQNFEDEIFIRWVECNIPYLKILYFCFISVYIFFS